MAEERLRGFVLRLHPFREKDAYLHLLEKERGLISLFCRGILSPANAQHSLARPFQLLDVLAWAGSSSYRLREGEVVTSFENLQQDLHRQAYACQLGKLAEDLGQGGEQANLLYEVMAYAFHHLNQRKVDGPWLVACGELRMLAASGFQMDSSSLFPQADGTYCFHLGSPAHQLSSINSFTLTPGARRALFYLLTAQPERLFLSRPDEGVKQQLIAFARLYTAYCLDQDYDPSDYLGRMEESQRWAEELIRRRNQEPLQRGNNEEK